MNWIKITSHDGTVAFVNPGQIVYIQKYVMERSHGGHKATAYGEIIAPGGAFIFWDQIESIEAWKKLGIE